MHGQAEAEGRGPARALADQVTAEADALSELRGVRWAWSDTGVREQVATWFADHNPDPLADEVRAYDGGPDRPLDAFIVGLKAEARGEDLDAPTEKDALAQIDRLRDGWLVAPQLMERARKLIRYATRLAESPMCKGKEKREVTVSVGGQQVSRRGFLVQLKKAVATEEKGAVTRVSFGELHHESGERLFGRKVHQAERMLMFTNSAVYWLAAPPTADRDRDFFAKYVGATNLAARRGQRHATLGDSAGQGSGQGLLMGSPLMWAGAIGHPDFEYFLRRWERFLGHPLGLNGDQMLKEFQQQEGARQLRMLRHDAAVESRRPYGMRSLVPVLSAHAESVLDFRARATVALADVYDHAVSLPEFILGDVLADGFGDDNADFIEAILNNKPNDYVRAVVAAANGNANIDRNASLARETLKLDVAIEIVPAPRG